MLINLAILFKNRFRIKRANIFWKYLNPCREEKILDLGGGDGSHIASIIPFRDNIYISDINKVKLDIANKRYGFKTILIQENCKLPFENGYFDIVFCSSVIEHVTVGNVKDYKLNNGCVFHDVAFKHQKMFAEEVRRIAKRYYVQTPNKHFIIESHTWLPFLSLLPRRMLVFVIKLTNKIWIKKTIPSWNLLTKKEMKELFPDANIYEEKLFGMIKSLIAIRIRN